MKVKLIVATSPTMPDPDGEITVKGPPRKETDRLLDWSVEPADDGTEMATW
jgi:hypothetical protein